MADINLLRTEITTDPLGRGYAAMGDGQAAESLNTRNRSASKSIPVQTLHAWFVFNGKWPSIETTAAGTVGTGGLTANQKLAAQSFIEICHYFADLDMKDSQYSSGILFVLDQFVERTIITSAQRTAVIALGSGLVSRAEELALGFVDHVAVAQARQQ
jgi:hypothetical protein